jgi:hypothetical protein
MTDRPTRKHYSHAKADEAKKQRRIEAEQRQQKRDKRSDKQQLAKLDAGGYVAKKERARLR